MFFLFLFDFKRKNTAINVNINGIDIKRSSVIPSFMVLNFIDMHQWSERLFVKF